MMTDSSPTHDATRPNEFLMLVAGALGVLLPGLGHFFIGRKKHALVYFVALTATFWGGVAIGGVRASVDTQQHKVWFAAQMLNAGYTGLVLAWQSQLPKVDPATNAPLGLAVWPSDEIARVYTGIAGMLNLLLLIDLLLRPWIRQPQRSARPPTTPASR